MAQSQIQEQKQEQRLQQSISQQQLLQSQLVELPIAQLAERINTEMNDNPALEQKSSDDEPQWTDAETDESPVDDDFDSQREREERADALDAALESLGRDDEELPVYTASASQGQEKEEMVYGAATSFYDLLMEQAGEMELTARQRYVMEYIIQSLDNDGLLRTSLSALSDELAIYHDIDISEAELEDILLKVQQMDPPGIAARSLQECLLLQIDRRQDSPMKTMMRTVVEDYFEEFKKKHWHKIRQAMQLSEAAADELNAELRRLNPKPGAAMGEVVGRSMQQITPDFFVDTQDDGSLSLQLNTGDVPQLQVSQSFADLLNDYQKNKGSLSRQMKEALLYTRQKVEAAQGFIEAVRSRQRTLTLTMKAIMHIQHRFFEEGDESLIRPMILKDVAERTGLDLSTISRVSNSKYVQTRWGVFPLKFFFSDSIKTDSGEELSTREVKAALRDIIQNEDKKKPFNDETLSAMLAERGFPIARRTVAKYREQMGFPVARLRK